VSKSNVDYANEIILTLSRDELETVRESLRLFSINNARHGFEARAKHADNLRDKIVNIILDTVQRKVDRDKELLYNSTTRQ
jgi:hypothetical protein